MKTLESYLLGAWHAGQGEPAVLVDPTTEEPIAECRSADVDWQAVLEHARQVGGPALRALSFQERGELLKALAAAIHEYREELIELSMQNGGCTRGDAKFDIDGATGTLAAYARFARALPEGSLLPDGEGIQLGRTPRFWGQHVRVPLQGAAVHINAFNFPAWGQCEKMACALLAGVPVIEKAGTPTAMVAHRVAQIIVASGVLPEGAYQSVSGSTGALLSLLGPQDCLAFTGSSGTGAKLRGLENLVRHNTRVNVEADSLNCAILGPDVDGGDDCFGEFLQNVSVDMTQKTGQKCTAVRRVLVPAERMDEVAEELMAALGRIKVGAPDEDGVRMGPLASAAQFEDVRAGIGRLAEVADVVCGGAERLREPGYFLAPTLLRAREPEAEVLHSLEVFGPVATLIPYSGEASEAARIANLGGGSLVASAYSNDAAWATELATAIAPWHGRVWLGSDRVAGQASAPGLVLPMTTHGGPGRAGGGEELGGLLGLEFYTWRVAVQGFQGVVKSGFGRAETAQAR